jgi:hypothetical protein
MKSLLIKRSTESDGFTVKILPYLSWRTNTKISQITHKIEKEGALSNSFYKVSIIVIPKPDKNIKNENNERNSLMDIVTEILIKVLANQIQQLDILKITYHDQVFSFQGHNYGSIYINQ